MSKKRATTESNGVRDAAPEVPAAGPPPEQVEGASGDSQVRESNVPAMTLRHGLIRVVIWRNETDRGTRYNAVPQRLFSGADGTWHASQSLGWKDLPVAALLLQDAFRWISERYAQGDAPF